MLSPSSIVDVMHSCGVCDVTRDPDTIGGFVGAVGDATAARSVAERISAAGYDVSWAPDAQNNTVWVYVRAAEDDPRDRGDNGPQGESPAYRESLDDSGRGHLKS